MQRIEASLSGSVERSRKTSRTTTFQGGTSSRVLLISTALVALFATARAAPAEVVDYEKGLWYMGYLLGLRTQLDVCAERFPEFKERNLTAWASSVYWNPERDKALAAEPSTIADKEVSELARALPKIREVLVGVEATKLRDLCERFPERLETTTRQAFNEGTIQIRARLAAEAESSASAPSTSSRTGH